jgi:DNA transposition AAA+ family ATPase
MIQTLETQQTTEAQENGSQARLNIPIDKDNWKDLPADIQEELFWFHQYIIDERLSRSEAGQAISYDKSTVARILDGSYQGNWGSIAKAIRSFKKVVANRGQIQKSQFSPNSISKKIGEAFDYALANNTIAVVIGESGHGKTEGGKAWRDDNNHGRSVWVECPALGGVKGFVIEVATAVGHGKDHKNTLEIRNNILRAFNRNRMLIVDEAHRLIPISKDPNPQMIEFLREIHDRTKCGMGIIATARFDTQLRKGSYMYEQFLRRAIICRLPRAVEKADVLPILTQYIKRPGSKVLDAAHSIANSLGSFGVLVEILKAASRDCSNGNRPMADQDFFKAIAHRLKTQGELQYAKKD